MLPQLNYFQLLCAFTIIGILASSCANTDSSSSSIPSNFSQANEYRILSGDDLEVTFADEPGLTQQVTVNWQGKITLSFLITKTDSGELQALGKTPEELTLAINQLARNNGFLVDPRSQVRIVKYSEQTFVLYGQVNKPGRYPFPPGLPPRLEITEAIAIGEGYTRLARPSHITVKRGAQVFRVDLRTYTNRQGSASFVIQPGDVINVPERIF